ncbi:histidine kinase [Tamilnaduibacter salinus]|uniref:histidine kinase n=1 Tax=Tamilnaduibacter salinus TaxID=1484056 RepID=A0A2A2I284_9GAMM|nr:transporter substrate-binding domain-containing protein [Tamilnaduibacter salinus]PAV25426.1 histidine kinase [Tamilnaduibacter salinus]
MQTLAEPPIANQRAVLGADDLLYLDRRDHLKIGVPTRQQPLSWLRRDGTMAGALPDYARLLGEKLDIRIELVPGETLAQEAALRVGQLDALISVRGPGAPGTTLRWSNPLMPIRYGLFADQQNAAVRSLSDLEKKRVALITGDDYQYDLLEPVDTFSPVPVRTVRAGIGRIRIEAADALIAPMPIVMDYLSSSGVTGIGPVQVFDGRPADALLAFEPNNVRLQRIINSAIAAIEAEESREIRRRWLGALDQGTDQPNKPMLTNTERSWLRRNPDLRIAFRSDWPPFEYWKDDRATGLVPDLTTALSENLEIRFDRRTLEDWSDAERMLEEGEVDILPGLPRTPRREDRFRFTRSYLTLPIALVIRDDGRFIGDLRELQDERVGVVRQHASHEYLLINHPELNLFPVESVRDGLLNLSNGDIDVMVTHIPAVSDTVAKLGLSNLRITSITPYEYEMRMAVRSKDRTLLQILNKGLAGISGETMDAIQNRWIHLDREQGMDYTVVRRVVLIAVLVVLIFLYWNRKLSREVDERIRSENALRLSEDELREAKQRAEALAREAESASRAKSEFLANMSHEIRTPMNAVMGYSELLEGSVTDTRQRGYIESIKAGSRSLLTLINDILDLSRIEAGKMKLEFGPLDLQRLLEDVRRIFDMRARAKGLNLTVSVEEGMPAAMVLDETRVRQVLFNLVGNAIKFTASGEVGVTARTEQPANGNESDGCRLVIDVRDTGIGIPDDQQNRIFDAFEQQEGQSNRQYGGTGLGLAISRKLARMMGGELSVESTPGEGACFRLTLHDVETSSAGPDSQLDDAPVLRFSDAQVLVVDDNRINRQLVRDMLEPAGLVVLEASDGGEALSRVRSDRPDLVLMDIRMPVMDGFTCRAAMRQDPELADIPVVALTASVMPGDAGRIRESGFDGFLQKPVSRQVLLDELARFLDHEREDVVTDDPGPETDSPQPVTDATERRQLRNRMDEAFRQRWGDVRGSGDPEQLQGFADDLRAWAQREQVAEVIRYADKLLEDIEAFDLDRVHERLERYPELLA